MFSNPFGLFALLAVPAVVGLHLYRRRYETKPVAALFLWEEVGDVPSAGRTRQPLLTSPSFWLETLAALLAALAFAGPTPFSGDVPHQVVVVDGSASMEAEGAEGESAMDRAREWLRSRLRELPSRSRVTLIESGPEPRTVAGPAAWRDEALAALDGLVPGYAHHDPAPALDLARGLAGDADVLFLTDAIDEDEGGAASDARATGVETRAFGEPLDNVAIVAARREVAAGTDDGTERVTLSVANHSEGPRARTVRVLDELGGDEIAKRSVEIAAGATADLALDLPAGTGTVRVEIEPDALEVDDATHLAPARPREVRVAVFGDAALLRATMLASKNDGVADRVARVAPSTVLASDARSADLVLDLAGDAGVGASASTWVLRVVPPATPTAWVGPFLVERHHPLLVGTTFDGVAWVGDESADLGGAPIVSAGFATLVSERTVYEGREIALNTDLAAGTFTRSPDWPILLSNLVEWRRRALPGPRDVNLVVGQELWVGAPEGGTFVLEGPTGRVERSGTRELLFPAFELPGAYTLSRDGRRIADVGVGFLDATESDLRGLSSGSAGGGGAATARIAGGSSRSEWLLTLLALALVAADWWFLGRRGAR